MKLEDITRKVEALQAENARLQMEKGAAIQELQQLKGQVREMRLTLERGAGVR